MYARLPCWDTPCNGSSPPFKADSSTISQRELRTGLPKRGSPGGASGKEPTCQCRRHKRCRFDSWVRKIPWRRAWQPTPVFLPGESHGPRSLVGYTIHRVTKSWAQLKGLSTHTLLRADLASGRPSRPEERLPHPESLQPAHRPTAQVSRCVLVSRCFWTLLLPGYLSLRTLQLVLGHLKM